MHEIAPVFLKNEDRIEAIFFLYFIALLLQALIERELRRAMEREHIEELFIYPEERACSRPNVLQILRLFSTPERHALFKRNELVQAFPAKLIDMQKEVLRLLGVPNRAYQ